MNVLGRFADLITVNMHGLLDRAENPERMLAHLLRTLEDGLDAARLEAAQVIAGERGLRRELERHRAEAERWQDRARLALAQGREDLARRALLRKLDHEDLVKALEAQHAAAQQLSAEVKAALRVLERRLVMARHRQTALLSRQRTAAVRVAADQSCRIRFADDARLERLERRLADREDELLARLEVTRWDGDLEAELEELERSKRIDQELENLRTP